MELTKQVNKKATKRLASILLASAMGVSAFGIVGCFSACTITSSQGTETNQPEDKPNPDNPNPDKPTTQYSTVLQNVLNDSYYEDVLSSRKIATKEYSANVGPTPFTFLQSQGHDVEAYKKGTLKAESYTYMLDNDTEHLYVSTKAENVDRNSNYYTNYILKYNLSKSEYQDFIMLHKGNYIEAGCFVQELDKQKSPVIESEANIYVATYDNIVNYFSTDSDIKKQIKYPYFDVVNILSEIDTSAVVTIALHPSTTNRKMVINGERVYVTITADFYAGTYYNIALSIDKPSYTDITISTNNNTAVYYTSQHSDYNKSIISELSK